MNKADINLSLNFGESVTIHLDNFIDIEIESEAGGYAVHTIFCGKVCSVSVSRDEIAEFLESNFPKIQF